MEFHEKRKTIMLAGELNLWKWITNDPFSQEYFNKNENMEINFKEAGDDTSFTELQCRMGQ